MLNPRYKKAQGTCPCVFYYTMQTIEFLIKQREKHDIPSQTTFYMFVQGMSCSFCVYQGVCHHSGYTDLHFLMYCLISHIYPAMLLLLVHFLLLFLHFQRLSGPLLFVTCLLWMILFVLLHLVQIQVLHQHSP